MKPTNRLTFILVTGLIALHAGIANADRIEHFVLDPAKPLVIPVGTKIVTTVQFPHRIHGIFGYGLTKGDAPGTYHYAHPEKSRLIALRNLMPDKETFISVLLGEDALYVLHLKPVSNPPVAVHLQDSTALAQQQRARQVDEVILRERQLDPDASRLFNLLKLGKNERTFRIAVPHLYQKVESREVDYRRDDDTVATVVTRVHRFPEEDAVFLNAYIENNSRDVLQFDPGSLQVTVGNRTYPVALVDSPAVIPAHGEIPLHVIIRGGTEGERAHLSIKNEFRLVMPEYTPCMDDVALVDALGQVLLPPDDYDGPDVSLFPEPKLDVKGGSK